MRLFAGFLVGLGIAVAIIFVVESLGHALFPQPPGLDVRDPVALEAAKGEIPLGTQIFDLVGWTAGIFGGGLVGGLVAGHKAAISWLVGIAVFVLSAMTLALLSYPQWLINGAVICTVLSAGLAGRFAARMPEIR